MIEVIPARAETDEQYHRSGAWGSTLINQFIKSPVLAHWMMSGRISSRVTPAMRFGTMFHRALDPLFEMASAYRVGPDADGRSKAWREAEIAAKAESVELIAPEEMATLQQMVDQVHANPTAASLLDGAEHEVGFRMPSPFGSFRIQCRVDVLHRASHLIDIKTTADVDGFASSIVSYGYARQAALYRFIASHACGQLLPFVFLICEKQRPYRCRVVELSATYLAMAWHEVEQALRRIAHCYHTADWSDPDQHMVLEPPPWLLKARAQPPASAIEDAAA